MFSVSLEAKTRIGRNTNVIAAYAYTDARTLKSSPLTPENEGQRSTFIPYHQFSLWGDYALNSIGLPGVTVGGGVRRIGSSRSEIEAINHVTPGYTLVDAMISYTTGPWKLALNVTNLTDKTYVTCPYSSCRFGEPRNVVGTVSYRW